MRKEMLFNYLTLGYVQNPHQPGDTFYQHIHKLPARSFLRYDLRKQALTTAQYWSLDPLAKDISLTEEAAAEKLGALLQQSVSRRLRSDVPIGTSLSGGLDSSSILAFIAREQPANFKTFSAIFPGFRHDESKQIARTTEAFSVKNYQVQPDADSFLQHFAAICLHQEEPFQSASIVAQYEVFGLAKAKGVTVLLDGQGADETMAGYTKYYEWYWQELYRQNKALLKEELAQSPGADRWGWRHKLRAQWPTLAGAQLIRIRKKQQRGQADLSPDFVQSFGVSHYDTPLTPSLNSVLYYNTFINGLEELLQYADRNSMAHGREVRLPFLNHELVQFIFSLPANFKIRQGYTKWLLRRRMSTVLPDDIVWRKDKIGFEPPQQSWMQDKRIIELVQEAKQTLITEGILHASVLDKKIQPHGSHAADNFDWRYLVAGTLLR
jgi:asparagine synthase (glutamine-hydrolysing)